MNLHTLAPNKPISPALGRQIRVGYDGLDFLAPEHLGTLGAIIGQTGRSNNMWEIILDNESTITLYEGEFEVLA